MRLVAGLLTGTLLVFPLLSGCDDGGAEVRSVDYFQVCVDQVTQVRLPDAQCDGEGEDEGVWYYLLAGVEVPKVSGRVKGGTRTRPQGPVRSAPRAGVAAAQRRVQSDRPAASRRDPSGVRPAAPRPAVRQNSGQSSGSGSWGRSSGSFGGRRR